VYPITHLFRLLLKENTKAKPLNKAMMQWFFKHTLASPSDKNNPYLAVLKGDVKGLPPATVITAEIDPLRSEGKA
jgi:acetyl esterase